MKFVADRSDSRGEIDKRLSFVKMHGLQNHFVILDQRYAAIKLQTNDIVRICDPCVGIGGEQLLTIEHPTNAGLDAGAYAAMRIFNIDGREVDACGNATRCMAQLLLDETSGDSIRIETAAGVLQCSRAGEMRIRVILGPISQDWRAIPTSHEVDTLDLPLESGPLKNGMALSIGVPHAVFFVDRLDIEDLKRYAPRIQNDPIFPEGISVGAVEVVDPKTLRAAFWERPGILTRACGTGACVAAYAALKRDLVGERDIKVLLPAGELEIRINEDRTVVMTGPVAYAFHGFVDGH